LKHEPLVDAIEQTNLECADLVVVVSQPLRDELVERGIDADAIVVAPNGADPARFRPDVDGSGVRRDLQLDDAVVVGFVGSFGRWHGAEVLAGSFARLLAAEEASGRRLRLLMIGEGETLPEVKRRLSGTVGEETVRLPGSVAYEQIPAHLAACDILVAPQVENADGSPFFGSPTKLFEYMAMGRAVVASKLGQMADVVADGRSGLLARPGDEADLARAISRLASDQALRCRLGAAARAAVLARHTWRHHVDGILGKLEERCP
jgi:glycosyltransferase involved in cell wall biosynthesis